MGTDFSLVSWNIFQGLEYRFGRRRWVRNHGLEDQLSSLDADVLVLPEAWLIDQPDEPWAARVAEQMGYDLHQWVSDKPSRTRERAKWRMVIMTRIPCRRIDDHVMPELAPYGQRAVVQIELESGVRIAGAHLYGVHLLTKGKLQAWKREREELQLLSEQADVIAGDLNMWSPVVHRDTPSMRSAFRGRTFPADRPHSQIDHVLVSERMEVVSAERLPRYGSDHLGIRTSLRMK